LINCIKKDPSFMVVVDHEKNVKELNTLAEENKLIVNVLVDIDSGQRRTGISPDRALSLAKVINALPALKLKGIQCYAGHVQHIQKF